MSEKFTYGLMKGALIVHLKLLSLCTIILSGLSGSTLRGYEKQKTMNIATIIVIFLVMLSCIQNSITLVKKYEKLHNSHDIDDAMLLYIMRILSLN